MTHFFQALKLMALIPQVGLVFATCLGVGILSGYYLDQWMGSSPILSICLGLLGGVAGGFSIYRLITARGSRKKNGKRKD
ncbi:AtpZ/AtpI family protein [bacterium]|jgi:F0F1-type ATP synthase assembly protein I|nr:AtpZ/AtpI family protein [bacterium]